ncbi:tail fiber protein [Paenibacillus sp. RC67]|uniref:phage tail protein n=1 Tax=Paenibacillus sp. RC67 TaxID=3039392 RepID=UPI0024ACDF96|nr:tail fiber protein [Paenibacillus sp. RC67]
MSAPFVAEIRIFAGNFAPKGWALCNGQLMPISQNTALFSLLGTNYGGDGKSTFGLPDLQGRVPLGQGNGEGLSDYVIGQSEGSETVTLLSSEMPQHTHNAMSAGASTSGTEPAPQNGVVWANTTTGSAYDTAAPTLPMSGLSMGVSGGNQAHNNRQPYLGLTFIIALQGVFPPRS